jgi:hypothetical protein
LAEHVCLFDESQVHFANPSLSCGKGLDNRRLWSKQRERRLQKNRPLSCDPFVYERV